MASRLERGLRIFLRLQQGVNYDAMKLAEEMNVTRRTIFRDIALLKKMGIPIQFDVDVGYYVLQPTQFGQAASEDGLPPDFDANELGRLLNTLSGQDADSDESIRKIVSMLRGKSPLIDTDEAPNGPTYQQAFASSNQFDTASDLRGTNGELKSLPEPFESLCQSISGGKVIWIVEQSLEYGDRKVRFIPTQLTFDNVGWRVSGTTSTSEPISLRVRDIHIVPTDGSP